MQSITFAVVLLAAMIFANPGTADAKNVTFINNTGNDIVVLNCTPASSKFWLNDLLGDSVLKNGDSITLDFDFERWALHETWNFQAHYSNGYADAWNEVDVWQKDRVTFRKGGSFSY